MAGKNILGYTKEDWDALSKRQRRKENFKLFKQNVVPALLGGSLGATLFAKEPSFRKLGAVITAIGVTGAVAPIDPTNFKGSFDALKAKGYNVLNLRKNLTNDQKNGLRILGEQIAVKSKLGFKSNTTATIQTDTNESYDLEYDGWGQITTEIGESKGLPSSTAKKVAEIVAAQPASKQANVKSFLKKLWEGVYTNLPQIIATMQNSGLEVPSDFDPNSDGWDGTANLPEGSPAPTATTEKTLFGVSQTTILGGAGLGLLGYAVFKK